VICTPKIKGHRDGSRSLKKPLINENGSKDLLILVFGFFYYLYIYENLLILRDGVSSVDNSLKTVHKSGITVDKWAKTVDTSAREKVYILEKIYYS
jgi:hypothetical protein